jgi:hypothetical protein
MKLNNPNDDGLVIMLMTAGYCLGLIALGWSLLVGIVILTVVATATVLLMRR